MFKIKCLDLTKNILEHCLSITYCEICRQDKNLHIDHCHKLNSFRGILCHHCNTGLGQFRESEMIISNTIKYLEDPSFKRELDSNNERKNQKYKKNGYLNQIRSRFRRAGIDPTSEQISNFLKTNVCNICKEKPFENFDLCIDHNHENFELRGFLCLFCNLGIGSFKDKISNLENAKSYLENAVNRWL